MGEGKIALQIGKRGTARFSEALSKVSGHTIELGEIIHQVAHTETALLGHLVLLGDAEVRKLVHEVTVDDAPHGVDQVPLALPQGLEGLRVQS